MTRNRSARSNRRTSAQLGMTMIEIVIAVGILGFMMSVAYRSLTQIITTKALLDDERDVSMIANAVLGRLTREISLAVPNKLIPTKDEDNQTQFRSVFLQGESQNIGEGASGDSITFMAKNAGQYIPDGQSQNGIVQITYRVARDPDDNNDDDTLLLIRDEVPDLRPLEIAYRNRLTFPITNRLVQLKFRYFDSEQDQWSDEWGEDSSPGLPGLVKLTVEVMSESGKVFSYTTIIKVGQKFERF